MKQKFYYTYVFLTGIAVMGTEMAASKLAAPYFGTSTIVWANIIGVILLAMSAGYWIGGKTADRYPTPKLLFSLSLGAGVLLTSIPLITDKLFAFLTGGMMGSPLYLILLTFLGTLLVFTPPIFILAMVSPFVLRLWAPAADETGKVAGRLNAFSTLGSIAGTFVPSLVLIPLIGTRATIYILALILILVSALGLRKWWVLIFLTIPLLALIYSPHSVKAGGDVLWEKETTYQYAQVIRQSDDSVALVYNEGNGTQSVYRPGWKLHSSDYYDYYLTLPYLQNSQDYKTWILGSAGGTMLGLFHHYVQPAVSGLEVVGVEIDPAIIPLGKKYFGLTGEEGKVVNADARTFLRAEDSQADLIIIDAYTEQIYIPSHLSTVEFYSSVKEHLRAGGIAALNINAISPSSPILLSFQRTMSAVFDYVYILPVPDSWNYVLLASQSPIDPMKWANIPESLSPFVNYMQQNLSPAQTEKGLILTDDHAPVEFLTDQMIWEEGFQN